MAKFKYKARTKEGELQVGYVESFNKEGATNILTSHNLFILSIENAEVLTWYDRFLEIFKKVKQRDLMVFSRQLSLLMESKVPLLDSLKSLYEQTSNGFFKDIIYEIQRDVEAGLSLSQALAKHDKAFSEFFVSIIRSAEVTGQLEEAALFLADYIEKESVWRSKIVNALIYPIFLIVGFFAVVILMVTVVFPKILPVFEEMNVQLPIYTRMILGSGTFLLNWWWAILVVIIPFIFFLIDYARTKEGKVVINETLLRIPVLGELYRKLYVARFAESLSVLLKGGVPIAQSLEITSHSIGSYVYRDLIHKVAEKVREGELLSDIMKQEFYYFPILVSQMVAVGEKTGRMEEILSKIAIFYNREVEDLLNRLAELIQPFLIAFIGIFIAILFASIMMPLFNLMQGFRL